MGVFVVETTIGETDHAIHSDYVRDLLAKEGVHSLISLSLDADHTFIGASANEDLTESSSYQPKFTRMQALDLLSICFISNC